MMMQAAVYHTFGGPIRIETISKPQCPLDGVIIRVKAVGVCRSDYHGWKGHDTDIITHGLPFVPGHEVCGIITEIGTNMIVAEETTTSDDHYNNNTKKKQQQLQIGDRVAVPFILSCGTCTYCHHNQSTTCLLQLQPGFTQYGGFAEYMAIPRAQRNICLLPTNVSYQQAAALGCRFTTAYRAVLQQGRLVTTMMEDQKKNQNHRTSIAIFGCGGLGLSCILWAVTTKCPVIIAIDVSDRALEKAQQLGATHIINTTTQQTINDTSTNTTLQNKIQQIVHMDGVDISIEASGFVTACENAIHCTRRGGRMVQVGLLPPPPTTTTTTTTTTSGSDDYHQQQQPNIPMNMIAGKEIEIVGSHGFAAVDLPILLEMVARNTINPAILIEQEVTLQEGAQAIEDMEYSSPLGIIMVTKFPNDTDDETPPQITSRL